MAETKSVWQDLWQRDMTLLYNLRFWALTLLRMFLGVLFVYHGFLRLFIPTNLEGSAVYFSIVGIPFPAFSAYAFGIVEFACGLLLFFGILTRWSALLLLLEMLEVFFAVHIRSGFLVSQNGYEFVLVLMAALFVVVVNGAGHFSVERMLSAE